MGSLLGWCLFRTFFGWWIPFLAAATLWALFRHGLRYWFRRRRFLARQAARLDNPGDAEVRYELALLHAEGKRWRKAEARAREALEIAQGHPLYPQIPHRFARLHGDCLYSLRRTSEAAAAYRRALDLKSDSGYDLALLGVCRSEWRSGRPEAALEFARHTIDQNTSALEAYFRWAQAAAALGRDADADEAARKFHETVSRLVHSRGHRTFRWRLAFAFFPLARRLL